MPCFVAKIRYCLQPSHSEYIFEQFKATLGRNIIEALFLSWEMLQLQHFSILQGDLETVSLMGFMVRSDMCMQNVLGKKIMFCCQPFSHTFIMF